MIHCLFLCIFLHFPCIFLLLNYRFFHSFIQKCQILTQKLQNMFDTKKSIFQGNFYIFMRSYTIDIQSKRHLSFWTFNNQNENWLMHEYQFQSDVWCSSAAISKNYIKMFWNDNMKENIKKLWRNCRNDHSPTRRIRFSAYEYFNNKLTI